ncbi:hypothetical protein ACKC9G_01950 [Pokkaliibacter sp. CJK22405]|uniref:hypothetical protein n=1 Tax=Pokkaliibacter sp. CJK22405 TaxID=3384615 RepID=UPI0039846DC8
MQNYLQKGSRDSRLSASWMLSLMLSLGIVTPAVSQAADITALPDTAVSGTTTSEAIKVTPEKNKLKAEVVATKPEDLKKEGLYISTDKGLEPLPEYDGYTFNYSDLGTIPWRHVSQPLELVAKIKGFNPDILFVYTRPLDFSISRDLQSPRVTAIDADKSLYRIAFGEISPNSILVIESEGKTFAMTLTDPKQVIVKELSNTAAIPMTAASHATEALKAFPDDPDILHWKKYWDEKIQQQAQ